MKTIIFAICIVFAGCNDLAPVETITDDKDEQIAILKERIAELEFDLEDEIWVAEYEINRLNDLNLALKKKIGVLERATQ